MEKCNNGVSSGRVTACMSKSSSSSSKKQKHKKVPQRGLGVAQLEKIRLEEEQNMNHHAGVVSPSSSVATVISTLPPLPSSSSSSSSSSPSSSCINKCHIPSLPYSPRMANANAIWQGGLGVAGHQYSLPRSHNFGEFCVGKESFNVVDHGMAYRNNITGLVQRPQQPCSSLVNVSSTTLTSSVLINQMDPPSNQRFGNNFTPLWAAEEEKMTCLKRPYPFSLDDPPGLTINYKIPTLVQPDSRSDNRGPDNHVIRESSLFPVLSKTNSKQSLEDTRDFLTLATPATSISFPNTYLKHPPNRLPLHDDNLPDIEPPPSRGAKEDLYLPPLPKGSKRRKPCRSFLPPPQVQCCEKPTTTNNHNGIQEEGGLDLDLKL